MPEFADPHLLFLLVALGPLLVGWWRGRRGALRYGATASLGEVPAGRKLGARWGGLALRGAALALLVVALAGPRWPDRRTQIPAEGIAVGLILDVSGSMAERDFLWPGEAVPLTRLEAVKRAFRLFVAGGIAPEGDEFPGRPGDLLGLVTLATRPEVVCPLTLSHSALLQLLDAEEPRRDLTESQTNVGDALAWALARLESAGDRRKVLILFSDGEHNVPPPALKPRQAARLAAARGVPVHVLDAGGEISDATNSDSAGNREAAEKSLRAVAEITGGRYFRAHDTPTLLDVCRQIDQLERRPVVSFQYRKYHEGYPWFGLGALALLGLTWALDQTLWRRLP